MVLSPEREAELLESNMRNICRSVDNFMARCPKQAVVIPFEDLVQEVAMAYLEYIRRCDSQEELERFPWYAATNAMTRYVLYCQPLKCSRHTGHFRRIVRTIPRTVSYDTNPEAAVLVDGMSHSWVDDKDTMMDLEIFCDNLNPDAERIVSMRLWGMTPRQIAGQKGVSEAAISKRLKRLRMKYHEFTEEDDSDD